jgi:phosphoribosylglycinamide formyltransferase 2
MIFTTPQKSNSIKIMLLGSGELGKEIAIEASRLGVEIIAVDAYENALAHLVSNKSYVIDMKNKDEVLEVIRREAPTYIVPEVEAISIEALFEAEKEGFTVIPNADAINKTMNRKNIRVFACEELKIKASKYKFVKTYDELIIASNEIGFPCVIKPIMSSSGYGQSVAKSLDDLKNSFSVAKKARGDSSELIVEEFIEFDYEITLLTVRNGRETIFCEPIGHLQKDGDYIFSWQPMKMNSQTLEKSKKIAKKITDGLGGRGVFGVEFFIKGDEVYFSEVSPRPHDTGMVTMITQSQSEFALHVRAILGLCLDFIFYGEGASAAFKSKCASVTPTFEINDECFSKNSLVRIFSKPTSYTGRRLAVILTTGKDSLKLAKNLITKIKEVS